MYSNKKKFTLNASVRNKRGMVSDPRSVSTSGDRYTDSPIDSCNLPIRTTIKEKAGILPFVDLRLLRPRVLSRSNRLRCRSSHDHAPAARNDPLRGRHSIQTLRGVFVSLSRAAETRRPEKADCE